MLRQGETDAIFFVRQLQEKFLARNKFLYLAFIDLENVFDRVPWQILRWTMRKLRVDEWINQLVHTMYCKVRSEVQNYFSNHSLSPWFFRHSHKNRS